MSVLDEIGHRSLFEMFVKMPPIYYTYVTMSFCSQSAEVGKVLKEHEKASRIVAAICAGIHISEVLTSIINCCILD